MRKTEEEEGTKKQRERRWIMERERMIKKNGFL
jgi:hypothetical protein